MEIVGTLLQEAQGGKGASPAGTVVLVRAETAEVDKAETAEVDKAEGMDRAELAQAAAQ